MEEPKKYIKLYYNFLSFLSINETTIICYLISKYKEHLQNNQINNEEWFFNSQEQMTGELHITNHIRLSSIKKLKYSGLIKTKRLARKGEQRGTYFKLNFEKIINILE